jgi:hypothetical protein
LHLRQSRTRESPPFQNNSAAPNVFGISYQFGAAEFRMSLVSQTIDAQAWAASLCHLGNAGENQNGADEAPAAISRDVFSRRVSRRFKLDAGTNCLLVPCERMFRAISAGVGGFGGCPPGLTANEPMKAFPNSLACVTCILKLDWPYITY